MTIVDLDRVAARVAAVPHQLDARPEDLAIEQACHDNLGVWVEQKVGLTNADFHWEWCWLAQTETRLCVVAPREHSKSATFTVHQTVWRSIYQPGYWSMIFTLNDDPLGKEILDRITATMAFVDPDMLRYAEQDAALSVTFSNGSRVQVAGARKSMRGTHPDGIIGDDVLNEQSTLTAYQRRKTERWWFGTISGMAHPGTIRTIGRTGKTVVMGPTRVHLVGTPFHRDDLLMGMKKNPIYTFRRYDAEVEDRRRVPDSWAVEAS